MSLTQSTCEHLPDSICWVIRFTLKTEEEKGCLAILLEAKNRLMLLCPAPGHVSVVRVMMWGICCHIPEVSAPLPTDSSWPLIGHWPHPRPLIGCRVVPSVGCHQSKYLHRDSRGLFTLVTTGGCPASSIRNIPSSWHHRRGHPRPVDLFLL